MPSFGSARTLATVRGEADGRASGMALGPLRRAFTWEAAAAGEDAVSRKALVVIPSGET